MNPTKQDIERAEEIVKKVFPDGCNCQNLPMKCAFCILSEQFAQALSKTQQETVKGCLEEARRMNYHGECVNCKCIVPNQMINAIKVKYPKE